jgi:hypothetical protein
MAAGISLEILNTQGAAITFSWRTSVGLARLAKNAQ